MIKLKKYIAMILIYIIVIPMLFTSIVQAQNMENEAVTKTISNTDTAKSTDATESAESPESTVITGNNDETKTDDTMESIDITESLGTAEISDEKENINTEDGTAVTESIDVVQSSEENKDVTESKDTIKEEAKNNKKMIIAFVNYDVSRFQAYQTITITKAKKETIILPTEISVINSNNEEIIVAASWNCQENILTTDNDAYRYELEIPIDYELSTELKTAVENKEATLPYIKINITPEEQSNKIEKAERVKLDDYEIRKNILKIYGVRTTDAIIAGWDKLSSEKLDEILYDKKNDEIGEFIYSASVMGELEYALNISSFLTSDTTIYEGTPQGNDEYLVNSKYMVLYYQYMLELYLESNDLPAIEEYDSLVKEYKEGYVNKGSAMIYKSQKGNTFNKNSGRFYINLYKNGIIYNRATINVKIVGNDLTFESVRRKVELSITNTSSNTNEQLTLNDKTISLHRVAYSYNENTEKYTEDSIYDALAPVLKANFSYNAFEGYSKSTQKAKYIKNTRFGIAGYGEGSSHEIDTRYFYGGSDSFDFLCNLMTNAGFDADYNGYNTACYGVYNIYQNIKSLKQKVNVAYQNADGSYGRLKQDINTSYDYGSTFSWSKLATTVYEAASINSYTVTCANTLNVNIRRNSKVSASVKISLNPVVDNWYKGKPTVIFYGSDPNLNISNITVNSESKNGSTFTASTMEGGNIFNYYATNVNGSQSVLQTLTIQVDVSKPTNVSITGDEKWTNNKVPLTITGKDMQSGLEKLNVQYSSNKTGPWKNYKTVTYTGKQLGTKDFQTDKTTYADKNGYYRVIATDRVGYYTQSSTLHVTSIDKSAPTLVHTIDGELKSSGWYKGDAVLNLIAYDTGGSGIKSITVNTNETAGDKRSIDVTKEGSNQYICYSTDNAGGITKPKEEITIMVDKTAPVNLSMIPNTTKWTKNPIKITVKAEDVQSGIGTIELQYTKDKEDDLSWIEYKREAFDGDNQVSIEIPVTNNGYYRLVVIDKVGFVTILDDILKVNNYDDVDPDGNTIGIERNTIQWVDESTGVNVTSYGSDNESGLSEVAVQEYNDVTKQYEDIKVKKYNGETTVENATYNTHINKIYRSRIADQAGNDMAMVEKDALEVDNIDSEVPTLAIESVSNPEQYISTSNGYIIQALIEDSQSGYSNAVLQKLTKDENGDELWEDTDTKCKIIQSTITDKEQEVQDQIPKLTRQARERVFVAASSANKDSEEGIGTKEEQIEVELTKEVRKQGDNKVIIEYTVKENGTYRLKGVDLVNNTAYTNDTIEINHLDGSIPIIEVKGNPTKWQNTDATITVIATDADSKIVDMTLNGEAKVIQAKETGEFYFNFKVTKNQEFEVTAKDEAGNTTTKTIKVTKIDKELPILTATKESAWNSDGYRNMSLAGSDLLSGIDMITLQISDNQIVLGKYEYEKAQKLFKNNYQIIQNGNHIITIQDHAGNVTTQTIIEAEAKILKAMEVVIPPIKTVYYKNENFCKKGMIVDAIYNDNTRTKDIKDYIILNGTNLLLEQTKIDLSYTENGVTVYTDTPIRGKEEIIPKPIDPEPEEPTQPDSPGISDTPSTPATPISPTPEPTIPTVVEATKEISKEPSIKVEEKKTETVLQDVKERIKLPFLEMLAVAGFIRIVIFIILSNVKVYSEEIDGSWKFLGKTRTIKAKEYYVVKLSKPLRIRAESDSYKLVFSKSFKKLHKESELVIKIDHSNYERYLPKDSDTVYVEHKF